MAEYIEREAFLAELKERHDYVMQDPEISKTMKWCEAVCFGRTKDVLDGIPAADVAPVVHGGWVFGGDGCVVCSECDEEESNDNHRNYCPNCGADMRERKESNYVQ